MPQHVIPSFNYSFYFVLSFTFHLSLIHPSQVFNAIRPDVVALQQVTPQIMDTLSSVLPSHHAVDETEMEDADSGWDKSGVNIMWNSSVFSLLGAGFTKLEMEDYPERGLFWVRLTAKCDPSVTFLVCTVHMPEASCDEEVATGVNVRIKTTLSVCKALRVIYKPKVGGNKRIQRNVE